MGDTIEVLVYGLGAIGSFYAFILQRCPQVRLTVVARSNYDAVKNNGILIDSHNHGQHRFHPHRVLRSPSEANGVRFQYVVCAHKAVDPDGAVAPLDPVISAETTVVILQNGVGNEDPFRRRFPGVTIISGVVWVGAHQPTAGVVHHTIAENTQLGLFTNAVCDSISNSNRNSIEEEKEQEKEKEKLDQFVALLHQGGTKLQLSPNIQIEKWEKVVWNVAWNAITTLTMQDTATWLASSEHAIPWTCRLMEEVIAVARASGVPLRDGLPGEFIARIQGLGKVRTSMQADHENGRAMEIEVILGVPVKRGREVGVATPLLETLYVLLVAVNGQIRAKREEEESGNV